MSSVSLIEIFGGFGMVISLIVLTLIVGRVLRLIRDENGCLYKEVMGNARISWLDRIGHHRSITDLPIIMNLYKVIAFREDEKIVSMKIRIIFVLANLFFLASLFIVFFV